uniref:Uncharacterized protein n=1 Tax=Pelusios castaneus TaxID=367368 RepID=A0A8C8S6S4_9SAUR
MSQHQLELGPQGGTCRLHKNITKNSHFITSPSVISTSPDLTESTLGFEGPLQGIASQPLPRCRIAVFRQMAIQPLFKNHKGRSFRFPEASVRLAGWFHY